MKGDDLMEERPFILNSFAKFLAEKKLMGSKCKKCGALSCPPRPICLQCHSDEMEWKEFRGKGKLVAFTVVSAASKLMTNEGYNTNKRYCAGVVKLEEGPGISAQILGADVNHPENIKIGTEVMADFVERGTWHFVTEVIQQRKWYLCFKIQSAK